MTASPDFDKLRDKLAWAELRKKIAQVVKLSVTDYDRLSRMGVWSTPESWMQCAIATAVRDQFYAMLEVSTDDLLKWYYSGQRKPPETPPDLRKGWVDIALFDQNPDPMEAHTVGLIEVKKVCQRYMCDPDAIRLKMLASRMKTVKTALVAAHLQYKKLDDLRRAIDDLLADIGARRERAAIEEYTYQSDACAAVVVEIEGLDS